MKAPDNTHVANADELGDVTWQKAKKSGGGSGGGCAELAALPDGTIGLRNSRNPNGPALLFTPHEIECLLDGARNGEFDHLI